MKLSKIAMKVLIVNTFNVFGGAARSAFRLHSALILKGIDSKMIVQSKQTDHITIDEYPRSFIQRWVAKFRFMADSFPVLFYNKRIDMLFSPSWLGANSVINRINSFNADIVHLHWINGGMIQIETLKNIKAPIVWTLHDNWAFTGGCHIMWDCEKYKDKCGSCPQLRSNAELDLSRIIFKRKQKAFNEMPDMVIVTVSEWLKNCAKNSKLLTNHKIIKFPNPVDTNLYKPVGKQLARSLWNLPFNKKIVLFGAISATNDTNKGFKELLDAVNFLDSIEDIIFVIFGSSEPIEKVFPKGDVRYVGHLSDDVSIVTLYSAADVMVVPSRQEAFGQTASESMACGTPVVAFAHTGLLDIVEHKNTGYLAKPFDTRDLAEGIEWILNATNYDELSENGRKKIVAEFDSMLVADMYKTLYSTIIASKEIIVD